MGKSIKGFISVAIFTLVLAVLWIPLRSEAATINVSTTAQLQNALIYAQPGDVIIIAAGATLTGNRTTSGDPGGQGLFYSGQSGTSSSKIVLKSADTQNPATLKGLAVNDGSYGLHITGDYWEIRDIKVETAQKGIMLDNASYNLISHVEVFNIGDEGVHFRDGGDYNIIEYSYIHDVGKYQPGYGEGVYVGSAYSTAAYAKDVHYSIIRNNTIGPNVTAEHIDIKEYTIGTIVENNIFNGTGISNKNSADSFIDVKGNDAIIRYNTGYRNNNSNVKHAFEVHAAVNGWGENNDFHHNTVYMDIDTPYIVNVPTGSAKACSNFRDPAGSMYSAKVTVYYCGENPNPPEAPVSGPNGSLIFSASDDSYVRGGSYATKNYGQDIKMYVKGNSSESDTRISYLKFRLGNHVSTVSNAKLRIYGKPSKTSTFTAYETTDAWCEDCLTWNNKPLLGTVVGSVNAMATYQYWEIDITSYVQSQAAGDDTVSIAITESAASYSDFNSSENSSNKPQLVITP
jgi:hypothetical protein